MTMVREGEQEILSLAGRLEVAGALELERIARAHAGPSVLDLDLAELLTSDEAGIIVLRRLRSDGCRLRRVSPYIALLLETGEAL